MTIPTFTISGDATGYQLELGARNSAATIPEGYTGVLILDQPGLIMLLVTAPDLPAMVMTHDPDGGVMWRRAFRPDQPMS